MFIRPSRKQRLQAFPLWPTSWCVRGCVLFDCVLFSGWQCIQASLRRQHIRSRVWTGSRCALTPATRSHLQGVAFLAVLLLFQSVFFASVIARYSCLCCAQEVLRVLKPGGRFIFHHHWIPGLGFPSHEVQVCVCLCALVDGYFVSPFVCCLAFARVSYRVSQALEKWCKDAGFLAIEDACADS